jgi:hypothetical protein
MLKKSILAAFAAALLMVAVVSEASAYGVAHVGRTGVGPRGAYHTGRTVVSGPAGVRVGGHTTAVGAGGGVYRAGAVGGAGYRGGVGGYRYAPAYGGVGYSGGYRYTTGYGYVR